MLADWVAGKVIPEPEAAGVAAPTPIVVLAFTVVATTVVGVVAPTVPLMLMDAVPVRFVTTPLAGVPSTGATRVNAVPFVVAPVMPANAPALLYWT